MKTNLPQVIQFTVPGHPVAQARPRIVRHGKYAGMANTPECDNYRAYFRSLASQYRPEKLIDRACRLVVRVFVLKPKSWAKNRVHAETKPDLDNFLKMVMDSLDGIIYDNDSRVVTVIALKELSDRPRVEVEVEVL